MGMPVQKLQQYPHSTQTIEILDQLATVIVKFLLLPYSILCRISTILVEFFKDKLFTKGQMTGFLARDDLLGKGCRGSTDVPGGMDVGTLLHMNLRFRTRVLDLPVLI